MSNRLVIRSSCHLVHMVPTDALFRYLAEVTQPRVVADGLILARYPATLAAFWQEIRRLRGI